MDAFFASIEQRDRPELWGRPVAVGHPTAARSVVAAASYEARAYGVRSAMPMARAKRLCPHLLVVRPDMARYRAVSARLRAILLEYTELIEPLSMDECYMDVTRDLKGIGSATWVAQELRERVREELGLTASAGVSSLKFVAKLASDEDKPDGLCVVEPGRVLEYIRPLPVGRLWGVGPVTRERLHGMGIWYIRDLADADLGWLERQLGSNARRLHAFANGRDARGVVTERQHKSRGSERTLREDVEGDEEVWRLARAQLVRLSAGLERAGERARILTLKLRFSDFTTITRSSAMERPTWREEELAGYLGGLIERAEIGARGVRLVGVSVSGLEREDDELAQLQLLS
jgi:DNA polymerase-4